MKTKIIQGYYVSITDFIQSKLEQKNVDSVWKKHSCMYRAHLQAKLKYIRYGKWAILMTENKVTENVLPHAELVHNEKE